MNDNGTNGDVRDLPPPRGRVTVDGLSRHPFDHAGIVGAVAVAIDAKGQVHMHCSIDGGVLLDLLEIVKERYYAAPMRANLERSRAAAQASAIVVPRIGG